MYGLLLWIIFIGICAFGNTYFIILFGALAIACYIGVYAAEYENKKAREKEDDEGDSEEHIQ